MIKKKSSMKFIFLIFISLLIIGEVAIAENSTQNIRGEIVDGVTGEPLTGATVVLKETSQYAVAGLDGSFIIRNVREGEYEAEVSYISFETYTQRIKVGEEAVFLSIKLQSDVSKLGEVTVLGSRETRSEESERAAEKNADNILNVVGARTIQLSPDVTVANVAQRVSGVSLERSSSGDGQHAIVRGMDKRYNYTLVNGIKIPSPDVKNRYVPLDIFPSDLLDRLVVSKSLTPNMEGDAIGGVIDMRMRNAPDRLTVNANFGVGYSQMFFGRDRLNFDSDAVSIKSPHASNGAGYRATIDDFPSSNMNFDEQSAPVNRTFGLAVGDRFFNNRLGALLAGSYQKSFRGANSLFFQMDVDRENNNPFYDTVEDRQISTEQARGGLHSKLDYRISSNHTVELYAAAIQMEEKLARAYADTNLRIGRSQGPGTGRISHNFRSSQSIQRVYNTTLQGRHDFLNNSLRASWSGAYSLATNDEPDMVDLKLITGSKINSSGDLINEPVLLDRDLRRRWTNNSDQDLAGYLDLHYVTNWKNLQFELNTGTMYRHKNRENNYNQYLLRASPITQEWSGDIFQHSWNLFNPGGTPNDPLNYESEEDVFAYYGMGKVSMRNFQVFGGVRVEETEFSWISDAPENIPGKTGRRSYTDVLPSVHLRYSPIESGNIRASYFQSISRPNFFEVIPYSSNEGDFRERGNPFLERTQAQNVDLRLEYFPTALDKIMVAGFYKEIKNPIESALLIEGQAIFLQPNNFGTAHNYGVEVDVTKYFRNYGLRGFYNYTDSRITTTKIERFRNTEGSLTSRELSQTRPLQGQSKHVSNISFLYKNVSNGTDAQLSAVYTGGRIIGVSPYYQNDIWQRSFWQLDFSLEQQLLQGVVAYAKVNNLLNTPLRADVRRPNTANPHEVPYLDVRERTLVQEDFYQQTWLIGFKYSL